MSARTVSIDKLILYAWKRIISEPPKDLLNIIIEDVKSHHNVCVDAKDVADFLNTYVALRDQCDPSPIKQRKILGYPIEVDVNRNGKFKNTDPQWFCFAEEERLVKTWKDLLVELCTLIAKENPEHFEEVLHNIRGKRREYFSKDQSKLKTGRPIPDTEIYVETNLTSNNTMSLCNALSRYFGYGEELDVRTF